MKVLLVNPKTYPVRVPPLGLGYIAAVLEKEEHDVRIFDPPPYEKKPFEEELTKFEPELIGFTCTSLQSALVNDLAKKARQILPNIPIVVGGPHPTAVPNEVLKEKQIDFVVIGEGEETIVELASALESDADLGTVKGIGFKENSKVKINLPRPLIPNVDEIPLPARHLFPMDYYTQRSTMIRGLWLRATTMMSSRGCVFNCIYCSSKTIFGRKFRPRSSISVVDEMEMLINKYKLEGLVMNDDTFTLNKKRVFEICEIIKERGLEFKWQIQSRVNTLSEDIVKKLKEAGVVQISFGVESGSQKVLDALNKGTTVQQAIDAFRLCKKHGIRTLANFMIGNPSETKEDIKLTAKLAKKLDADYVDFYITTPYPGTDLLKMAVENGWIDAEMDFGGLEHGMSVGDRHPKHMEINFTSEELEEMRSRLKTQVIWKKIIHFLRQPRYVMDMALISILTPTAIPNVLIKFIKTRKLEESLRVLEEAQRKRKFLS